LDIFFSVIVIKYKNKGLSSSTKKLKLFDFRVKITRIGMLDERVSKFYPVKLRSCRAKNCFAMKNPLQHQKKVKIIKII